MTAAVTFLLMRYVPSSVVRYPDGREELLLSGGAADVVARWNQEHLPALREQSVRAWEADEARHRAEWEAAGGEVDAAALATAASYPSEAEVLEHLEQARAAWQARRDAASAGDLLSKLAWDRENPEPTLEDMFRVHYGLPLPRRYEDPASYVPLPRPSDPTPAEIVESRQAWWTWTEGGDSAEPRFLHADAELPYQAVASLLTNFRREGWTIRHVKDERIARHGDDMTATVTIGMTVLLER
jgi:hypothetical protein